MFSIKKMCRRKYIERSTKDYTELKGKIDAKLANEPKRKYEHTNTKNALEKQIKAIEEKIASLQEK